MKKIIFKVLNLIGTFVFKGNNSFRVICYHSISDQNGKYSINLSQFEKEILELKKHYNFVSLKSGLKGNTKKPSIALTLDDGYEDCLNILEFVKSQNIPVTVFVMSDPQHVNRKELNNNQKLLTAEQIKYLHKNGFDIGCHSSTHADFKTLDKKGIEKEILNSKKLLERKLGVKIDYFAYPKGVFCPAVIYAVKKAGFKAAFATNPGVVTKNTNIFAIPRFVMEKTNVFSIPGSFSETVDYLRRLFYKNYEYNY